MQKYGHFNKHILYSNTVILINISCTALSRFNKHILYRNTVILINISCTEIGHFNKHILYRNTVQLWHLSCREIYFEHNGTIRNKNFQNKKVVYSWCQTQQYVKFFNVPHFNGDIFRYFRRSSGRLIETALMVHAEQLCSMGSYNT